MLLSLIVDTMGKCGPL